MIESVTRAVLLADVAGSTQLYETVGDEAAIRLVGECVDRMATITRDHGGTFVHSKGDDALCVFADASKAVQAASEMLGSGPTGDVVLHGGLHWGSVLLTRNEVFGDAVNLTARLASLANSGEVLISAELVAELSEGERGMLRAMSQMAVKGKAQPVDVYALLEPQLGRATQVTLAGRSDQGGRAIVQVHFAGAAHIIQDGGGLTVGRAEDCDVPVRDQRVSRQHGSFVVRHGLVEFRDRSSSGSYIRLGDNDAFFVRRQNVVLSGTGIVGLGAPVDAPGASLVRFEVARADGSPHVKPVGP